MPEKILYDEDQLLKNCAIGDPISFQIVFSRYQQKMFINALRFTKSTLLAEDLVQDIFIHLWVNRAALLKVRKFESFLYTVSRNVIIGKLRKPALLLVHSEINNIYTATNQPTAQECLEVKELEKKIQDVIDQLPPKLQLAFTLSRVNGLTHEEIARQMHISRNTSQNYIARAIATIRKHITYAPQKP